MKRRTLFLFTLLLCLLLLCPKDAQAKEINSYDYEWMPMPITVHVDNAYLPMDVDPTIQDGRTLIPLRAAGEALGAYVEWLPEQQAAYLSKDGKEIYFFVNLSKYYVNGTEMPLDVPPCIESGRTMIPLRVFAETLDTKVTWNSTLKDVALDTAAKDAPSPNIPDGTSADVARFIKKFYVQPDASDPITGSWMSETAHYTQKIEYPTEYYSNYWNTHYLFFTNYKGNYQCIHLGVEQSELYDNEGIVVQKFTAWSPSSNSYRIDKTQTQDMNLTYYRVPGNGYGYLGWYDICELELNGPTLIQLRSKDANPYNYNRVPYNFPYEKI